MVPAARNGLGRQERLEWGVPDRCGECVADDRVLGRLGEGFADHGRVVDDRLERGGCRLVGRFDHGLVERGLGRSFDDRGGRLDGRRTGIELFRGLLGQRCERGFDTPGGLLVAPANRLARFRRGDGLRDRFRNRCRGWVDDGFRRFRDGRRDRFGEGFRDCFRLDDLFRGHLDERGGGFGLGRRHRGLDDNWNRDLDCGLGPGRAFEHRRPRHRVPARTTGRRGRLGLGDRLDEGGERVDRVLEQAVDDAAAGGDRRDPEVGVGRGGRSVERGGRDPFGLGVDRGFGLGLGLERGERRFDATGRLRAAPTGPRRFEFGLGLGLVAVAVVAAAVAIGSADAGGSGSAYASGSGSAYASGSGSATEAAAFFASGSAASPSTAASMRRAAFALRRRGRTTGSSASASEAMVGSTIDAGSELGSGIDAATGSATGSGSAIGSGIESAMTSSAIGSGIVSATGSATGAATASATGSATDSAIGATASAFGPKSIGGASGSSSRADFSERRRLQPVSGFGRRGAGGSIGASTSAPAGTSNSLGVPSPSTVAAVSYTVIASAASTGSTASTGKTGSTASTGAAVCTPLRVWPLLPLLRSEPLLPLVCASAVNSASDAIARSAGGTSMDDDGAASASGSTAISATGSVATSGAASVTSSVTATDATGAAAAVNTAAACSRSAASRSAACFSACASAAALAEVAASASSTRRAAFSDRRRCRRVGSSVRGSGSATTSATSATGSRSGSMMCSGARSTTRSCSGAMTVANARAALGFRAPHRRLGLGSCLDHRFCSRRGFDEHVVPRLRREEHRCRRGVARGQDFSGPAVAIVAFTRTVVACIEGRGNRNTVAACLLDFAPAPVGRRSFRDDARLQLTFEREQRLGGDPRLFAENDRLTASAQPRMTRGAPLLLTVGQDAEAGRTSQSFHSRAHPLP